MGVGFASGQGQWIARLDKLRNVVRQELVARQLRAELPGPPGHVLDVGCGQGTQALALAHSGYRVTGLDASTELLDRFSAALLREPVEVQDRVQLVHADIAEAGAAVPGGEFQMVTCHGVLMYFPEPDPVLDLLAHALAPSGVLSLLVRNSDALAMRPGLLGDWHTALAAFDTDRYRNRHGVHARADHLNDLTDALDRRGLQLRTWYGVRVFTDAMSSDAELPVERAELDALLSAEERAGRTDPYRAIAGLLHLIAASAG